MALPTAYLTSTKNLESFFASIRNAKAPEKFSTRFLESLEYKSSSDRLLIGILKSLSFLDSEGRPQERYFRYLDQTQSAQILAEGIRQAYTAIAAFENSVREFISKTMLENIGENWWQTSVSEKIRNAAQVRMDEEEKVRWHVQRGIDPIQFTMLPNLLNIIRQNFVHFEPFIHNIDWAASIFDTIERSRNVIMHSGILSTRDISRVGSLIADWSRQVAT